MSLSRRQFLGTAAAGTLAATSASAATAIPTRILGRTGARVSILAFGCGSRFLMYKDEDQALSVLNRAIDLGITYLDTAYGYGDGLSEERVGKVMKTRRKEVWLATKVEDRTGDGAMRVVEGSLKRLQTGYIDLVHIHSLGDAADLASIEAPDGVLMRLCKLRDEKVIRAVGITCHTDPAVLRTALGRNDFDCTQMALNAARNGMAPLGHDPHGSFETLALPVAKQKNLGVIAMKVFAQDRLKGKASPDDLIRYSMSLPVAAAVIGMPTVEYLEHNVEVAKNFQPLPHDRMKELADELAGAYKASIDQFFASHRDA